VPAGAVGAPAETVRKVIPSDRTYSFEDFQAIGFKKSKEYDVDGLTQATGAWYGFWRQQGHEPIDYELRFYPSHEAAVEHGTALADEASGDDAVLDSDAATWKEDANELRMVSSVGSLAGASTAPFARYSDFAILGNVVMLCQGGDSAESLKRCEALIDALGTE